MEQRRSGIAKSARAIALRDIARERRVNALVDDAPSQWSLRNALDVYAEGKGESYSRTVNARERACLDAAPSTLAIRAARDYMMFRHSRPSVRATSEMLRRMIVRAIVMEEVLREEMDRTWARVQTDVPPPPSLPAVADETPRVDALDAIDVPKGIHSRQSIKVPARRRVTRQSVRRRASTRAAAPRFSAEQVGLLRRVLHIVKTDPPSRRVVERAAAQTNLTVEQVRNWFKLARRRQRS